MPIVPSADLAHSIRAVLARSSTSSSSTSNQLHLHRGPAPAGPQLFRHNPLHRTQPAMELHCSIRQNPAGFTHSTRYTGNRGRIGTASVTSRLQEDLWLQPDWLLSDLLA